jgi:hypothetical protein
MTEIFIPGNNITVNNINGIAANTLVSNAGASTNTAIALFSGVGGTVLQNSTVLVDGVGNLTGVGSINGITIANVVSNAGASVDTAIALFSGVGGKTIQNSVITVDVLGNIAGVGTINTITLANLVSNAGASTDTAVAIFSGVTGKIVQNSAITVDVLGNLAGVGTINGAAIPSGTNTGDVTLAAVGATPNVNGASLAGQVLTLQPADTTNGGVVSTATQAFGGQKDFSNGGITLGAAIAGTTNLLQGNSGYYRTSADINVTWDPASLLFVAPFAGTLRCERIGNMIFIKIDYVPPVPVGGGGNTISSNVGVIPVPFRPATQRGAFMLVIDGSSPPIPPFNVVPGFCILDTAGTLEIGSSRFGSSVYNGILADNVSLFNFNGPNGCGLIEQTIVFQAD